MKTFAFVTAGFLILTGLHQPLYAQNPHYVAHEWGTFTGLSGSDGIPLNGLYVEEEHLPPFVYNIGGKFPDLSYDFGKGTPEGVRLEHVTIKMETPVIYFYSKDPFEADVKVRFTHGLIGQWFPADFSGVSSSYYNNFGPVLDFGNKQAPVSNSIEWKPYIMPLNTDISLVTKSGETHTWTAPRATDANIVRVNNGAATEYEKFLFYRGLGNFDLPVKVSFDQKDNLVIQNQYTENIPYFFVYDKEDNGDVKVWFTGSIAAKASQTVRRDAQTMTTTQFDNKLLEFQNALTAAGLYDRESAAMLATWKTSYFDKPGLRVFWIVPRNFTDNILPLSITPSPSYLQRVLIGRSEIITPEAERKLYEAYQADNTLAAYANDRFVEAWKERMACLAKNPLALQSVNEKIAASSGLTSGPAPEKVVLFPNPAHSNLTLMIENATDGGITVAVTDLTGRTLIRMSDAGNSGYCQRNIDIGQLHAGIYLIQVQTGTQSYIWKLVKE